MPVPVVAATAIKVVAAGLARHLDGPKEGSERAGVSRRTGWRLMGAGPGQKCGTGSKASGAWAAVVALGLAGLLALGFVTARVGNAYPVSSDDATGVLEAASILQGNLLLKGWTVSNVSFLTTDLPFYVAGVAIRGLDPSLLREVPSAVYVTAVGFAVVLAASGSRSAGLAAATVVVLLGLPAGGLAEFATKGYTRVGTSIGLLAGLIALGEAVGRRVSMVRLGLYTAVVGLTLLSDTYMLVIAVAAVLVVCLLGALRRETYENLGLGRIAIATCLAVLLAQAGTWLIRALGGYEAEPLPLKEYLSTKDPLRMMAANARALANNLPSLYRCDLPDSGGWAVWAAWLGCLIGPALLACALWWGRPVGRRRVRFDFVGDVLWVSMGLGLAAFLASANEKDRGTLRYMVPFVLSGAVLTGRVISGRARSVGLMGGVLGVLAAAYGVTVAWDLGKPPAGDQVVGLARWLQEHELRQGYGPYWDASIVTASGRGHVAVRPVRGREVWPGRLVIEPFRWMSDEAWYREAPAKFVVYRPDPGPKYHFLINESVCAACFGPPSARHSIGPYVVLVWDRDLRPLLVRGLPWVP